MVPILEMLTWTQLLPLPQRVSNNWQLFHFPTQTRNKMESIYSLLLLKLDFCFTSLEYYHNNPQI